MQISGYSGNLPLSTQIIKSAGQAAQAPDAVINPEQVNQVVDRASDRSVERQQNRELDQSDKRSAATQLYSAAGQQQQIDTYLAVASESEIDSEPSMAEIALELRDDVKRYELAQHIASDTSRVERPEGNPAEPKPEPHVNTRA
jgi:hypothetical protein